MFDINAGVIGRFIYVVSTSAVSYHVRVFIYIWYVTLGISLRRILFTDDLFWCLWCMVPRISTTDVSGLFLLSLLYNISPSVGIQRFLLFIDTLFISSILDAVLSRGGWCHWPMVVSPLAASPHGPFPASTIYNLGVFRVHGGHARISAALAFVSLPGLLPGQPVRQPFNLGIREFWRPIRGGRQFFAFTYSPFPVSMSFQPGSTPFKFGRFGSSVRPANKRCALLPGIISSLM